MTTLCRWESSSRTCWKRTTRREECVFMWTRIRCRWSSARRAPGRRRLLLKFSFLGDFLPARLRCRGYRTVVPASQPVDTAVGAEETGPAAGHISCFILKA
nr:PREDICTED: uncharacterized protein LOC103564333 isoform X3 [Equus przewalskii]